MWTEGDCELHLKKGERFEIFIFILSGGAQLLDKGTAEVPRKVENFKSVRGAKIAASKWINRTAQSIHQTNFSNLTT